MRLRSIRNGAFYTCQVAEVVFTVLLVSLGAAIKVDAQSIRARSDFFADLLVGVQDWAWVLLVVFPLVLLVAVGAKKLLGPPWIWRAVHSLLTEYREYVFSDIQEAAPHHHRVTLFRKRFDFWFLPGWLMCVERSGHTTRKRIPIFKAPADNPDEAEGVAGTTWVENRIIPVNDLPDLSSNFYEAQIMEYAGKSWVSEEWVRKHRPLARSLCGIPVEVKGKPFGVIVLDSRNPDGIKVDYDKFNLIAKSLGKLLEGVL